MSSRVHKISDMWKDQREQACSYKNARRIRRNAARAQRRMQDVAKHVTREVAALVKEANMPIEPYDNKAAVWNDEVVVPDAIDGQVFQPPTDKQAGLSHGGIGIVIVDEDLGSDAYHEQWVRLETSLAKRTVPMLKDEAADLNIGGLSKMRKAQLIEAIVTERMREWEA